MVIGRAEACIQSKILHLANNCGFIAGQTEEVGIIFNMLTMLPFFLSQFAMSIYLLPLPFLEKLNFSDKNPS